METHPCFLEVETETVSLRPGCVEEMVVGVVEVEGSPVFSRAGTV